MFQVEDTKSDQRNSSVFHNLHSMDPRIPLLCIELASLTVMVNKSNIKEAEKSRRL